MHLARALEVKLESVDNSTSVIISGKCQTVSSLTVIVFEDKTWSHPKDFLYFRVSGNPESLPIISLLYLT